MQVLKTVLISWCLSIWLSGCSAPERVVIKEVGVEIPGPTRYVPVSAALTEAIPAQSTPAHFTYREALILWRLDQGAIDKLNARLKAISELEAP
jgi:hypothetical protein